MERLHSVQLFPPDLEAADRALIAYSMYSMDADAVTQYALPLKSSLRLLAKQYPDRHKFLLTENDIIAILNGIAVLDETDAIKLHGPNAHPDEKFRTLQSNLLYELNRDR